MQRCNPTQPRITQAAIDLTGDREGGKENVIIGAGTELKRLLGKLGINPTPDCSCEERALIMDLEGPQWCRHNVPIIVGWLREEAAVRGLLFVETGAKLLIYTAIRAAEKKARMLENQW